MKKTHIAVCVFVGIYLFLTMPMFVSELINRTIPARNPNLLLDTDYNHIPMPIIDALTKLGTLKTDPTYPIVLVDNKKPIEVLVPAFANKTVFSGHPIHTISPDLKESMRKEFFNNQMDEAASRTFLIGHRIGYIVASNSDDTDNILRRLPFLTLLYSNPMVRIIKVNSILL